MIKIFNKNNKKYTQVFNFFTEENWEKQKSNYTKNFQAFFSGKKAEFAVSTDDETTQYFIGIGKENFQNFELQQVANKFSIQNKKNIQAICVDGFDAFHCQCGPDYTSSDCSIREFLIEFE